MLGHAQVPSARVAGSARGNSTSWNSPGVRVRTTTTAFLAGACAVGILWIGSHLRESHEDGTADNPPVISRKPPKPTEQEPASNAPRQSARRSGIPASLTATVVSTDPAHSLATLRIEGEPRGRVYRPGDTLLDATLATIEPRRVLIRRAGRLEFLELEAAASSAGPPSAFQSEPEESRRLPRSLVDAALAGQPSLEHDLAPTATIVNGQPRLELGDIEPGGFYSTLGLEPRDVLIRIDGEAVTDRKNPLWSALRAGDELELVVIREGRARSWRVQID